jgi:DNA repair exonuclease SbcCD ATPase subunit
LQKEMQKAKEAAAAMANNSDGNDAAAKEQLSQSLSSLQQKAAEMGLSLPNLDKALEALAKDQADIVMKELLESDKNLEKLKEMAQTLQQLQKTGNADIGKNLAEQLKKGQARSAKATLEKMAKQLAAPKLALEDMRKILEEVQKAAEPAADYGQLAEKLKSAAEKMQQGQRSEAAKDLEAAAKELEKLSDEMADMEAIKAALEALGRASMAIGNGQGMGMKGIGRPNPGGGKGGKPGRGFGDWADEEGWKEIPEISDLWENTEDDRGELDPRSNKDKGDGQLAENLDPTRLRGQLNPGGPMPSITLRGVSIKGQSRVAIEEAVAGAQSDAQSALSQEQIPKVYQNAVKGYFDDLKK